MTVRWVIDVYAADATGREMGVHCNWLDKNGVSNSEVFTALQLLLVGREPK